jgi:RNA 3'-terminal phosphate cyclase (ATP)
VLCSALSLSLLIGEPISLFNVRAGRQKPGLAPQHLTALRACARISGARVSRDRLGAGRVCFAPGSVLSGDYRFDIGTAGTASLVLQTPLPPLALTSGPSRLAVTGGSHVPWSPCFLCYGVCSP